MRSKEITQQCLFLLLCLLLMAGCEEDDGNSSITLTSGSVVELYPVVNQSKELTFESAGDWTASCQADWLTFSPRKGSRGKNTIKITTAATNKTKSTRSTSLTITSGSGRRNVTVVQSGKYAIFDKKKHTVSAGGGKLQLSFKSNLERGDNLQIRYSQTDWISWPTESSFTRTEWSGKTEELTVSPNLTGNSRTAVYILTMPTDNGSFIGLDTAYVSQNGVHSDYVSADYTADGIVTLLQRATVGKGIAVVLMGDGFADKHISDSTYAQVMKQTMENIFSEEPVKSMRDYFNVYAVTAVSRNDAVGEEYSTVFSTVPSFINSEIVFNADKVDEYVRKVDSIDFENSLAVVIVNSKSHNGVTSLFFNERTALPRQYAISLCTLMDGIDSEEFRQVLVHETIGHGLAKLADEYGYDYNGAPADIVARQLQVYHKYDWMLNVDTNDATDKVPWSKFIGESSFASESIGIYEGGFTYTMGIYRPTVESMMRSNQSPFNAPSRKAIYDRIRLLGEDKPTSSLDEFAAFDEQHKPTRWRYTTRSLSPWHRRPAPPIIKWE